MTTVFLEDAKTGIEYKATIKEVVKAFDHSFSDRDYRNCFEVTIYKPVFKIIWLKFYRKVITRYRAVKDVESVFDYVIDVFKIHLKDINGFREKAKSSKLAQEALRREMQKKYDSLPHKITLK